MDVDNDNNAASNPDLAREQHEREEAERWRDLDVLLTRPSNLAGPGFEPCPELRQFLASDACRILVVGAGGLGCELLKDLALTGFRHLDVIDMDTIDVSNLNRQFLFRTADVGKPKAVVAARKVQERVQGCRVAAHHARIEDMPAGFYAEFTAIVLGLDSLEARRYMNGVVCGMLAFEDAPAAAEGEEADEEAGEEGQEEASAAGANADASNAPPGAKRRRSSPSAPSRPDGDGTPASAPTVDLSTVKPVIDGGTEGFKGHARVILPGVTPCFECTLWLFPPQVRFPLCTLAETPRTPAHCVEYAHLIRWGQDRPGEEFDADDEEHMAWVFEVASERARQHGIAGVTLPLAQGVVKGIVPAVASTNAVVSAACVLETLKTITMCSQGLNNYMMYSGPDGVYTHTFAHERDPSCPVCSPGVSVEAARESTLREVIDAIKSHPTIGPLVSHPSVSHGSDNLYVRGALEELTRGNLDKGMVELLRRGGGGGSGGGRVSATLTVNDKQLAAPLRVRLTLV